MLVREVEALESGMRNMLLVLGPRNALSVQQISNGRDVLGHLLEVIIVHAKGVTTSGSTVVRLGRMCDCIEIGPVFEAEMSIFPLVFCLNVLNLRIHLQKNSLGCEPLHVGIRGRVLEVLEVRQSPYA